MKKLFLLVILTIQNAVFAGDVSTIYPQTDTIIKEDSMNLALLMVDFNTYVFESANVSYYAKCPDNCDTDSLPISMYFDSFWDDARVYFYYKYDSSLLFGAWILWMGTGYIFSPASFTPSSFFPYGSEEIPLPLDVEYYNTTIAGNFCTWDEYKARGHLAWDAVKSLEITRVFAEKPFRVGLYAYSRREGWFDPQYADWIVFLYRGNEFPVNVQNPVDKLSLSVFPNPVTDNIQIEFPDNPNGADIEVVNIYGSVCYRTTLPSPVNTHVISAGTWSPGLYFVKIKTGDRILGVKRVIKD